jgi:hypothetical protein
VTPDGAGEDLLRRLARESGHRLAELGVRAEDGRWIRRHAETIASLEVAGPRRGRLAGWLYRLARKAARIAR